MPDINMSPEEHVEIEKKLQKIETELLYVWRVIGRWYSIERDSTRAEDFFRIVSYVENTDELVMMLR